MDVDEPLQPVQPPHEPPIDQKRRCFCCGRKYGTRQLARHLRDFLARLDQEIAAGQVAGDEEDSCNEGNGSDHAAMDIDRTDLGDAVVDINGAVEAEGWVRDLDQGQCALN